MVDNMLASVTIAGCELEVTPVLAPSEEQGWNHHNLQVSRLRWHLPHPLLAWPTRKHQAIWRHIETWRVTPLSRRGL
jgi:hypothetical protein